jgi:hypothetical protein
LPYTATRNRFGRLAKRPKTPPFPGKNADSFVESNADFFHSNACGIVAELLEPFLPGNKKAQRSKPLGS